MSRELHIIGTKALLRALKHRGAAAWCGPLIIELLGSHRGKIFSVEEIVRYVWAGDPKGGPLDALGRVGVEIAKLRKRGFDIQTHHSRGYSLVNHSALLPVYQRAA